MPGRTVTERLRGRLRDWLKAEGWGAAKHLSAFSHDRPGGTKISPQELSYFLRNTPNRKPLSLDDLDDIAAYFRVSVGELFDLKQADLSGDEQRLVYAFRALPLPTQEHFLALLESASVSQQFVRFRAKAPVP